MTIYDILSNSGYKKKYIASQLGISSPTLKSKLEGRQDFTGTELKKLSELFSMSYDELLSVLYGEK